MLTFEDRSLSKALEKVKQALGPHALILRVESTALGAGPGVRVRAVAGPSPPVDTGDPSPNMAHRPAPAPPVEPPAPAQPVFTTVALVGPPGAGKTTTAVKLASHLRRDRYIETRTGCLTTSDPTLERLSAQVALDCFDASQAPPPPTAAATRAPATGAVQIIDTPGVAPPDSHGLRDVDAALRRHRPRLVYLVLPATTAPEWARDAVRAYGQAGVNRLILTQAEAVPAAQIVRLARATGLRLSYLCVGPAIDGDLIGRAAGEIQTYLTDGDGHATTHVQAA